ncbi:hypothetical protein GE21DRAFT_1313390 [Neurospora crassa]|nr:hypothetical protein B7N4.110 [imported] - Neurospora crassa [Neurospora crassa]KHE78880.1 hypothetical protein GE21DRAFT_1313390 [Neurospora crassa]
MSPNGLTGPHHIHCQAIVSTQQTTTPSLQDCTSVHCGCGHKIKAIYQQQPDTSAIDLAGKALYRTSSRCVAQQISLLRTGPDSLTATATVRKKKKKCGKQINHVLEFGDHSSQESSRTKASPVGFRPQCSARRRCGNIQGTGTQLWDFEFRAVAAPLFPSIIIIIFDFCFFCSNLGDSGYHYLLTYLSPFHSPRLVGSSLSAGFALRKSSGCHRCILCHHTVYILRPSFLCWSWSVEELCAERLTSEVLLRLRIEFQQGRQHSPHASWYEWADSPSPLLGLAQSLSLYRCLKAVWVCTLQVDSGGSGTQRRTPKANE